MTPIILRRFTFVCLLAFALGAAPTTARAQFGVANCPEALDAAVAVEVGQPVLVRLPVVSPEGARVSIFQPPIGGLLEPIDADGLDYIFIADSTFTGISELTYRVRPPFDCRENVLLGRVQLVGAPGAIAVVEDDTAPLAFAPQSFAPVACGLGVTAPLLLATLLLEDRRRRRGGRLKS